MNNSNHLKYIKYKKKYINAKNMKGGRLITITNLNKSDEKINIDIKLVHTVGYIKEKILEELLKIYSKNVRTIDSESISLMYGNIVEGGVMKGAVLNKNDMTLPELSVDLNYGGKFLYYGFEFEKKRRNVPKTAPIAPVPVKPDTDPVKPDTDPVKPDTDPFDDSYKEFIRIAAKIKMIADKKNKGESIDLLSRELYNSLDLAKTNLELIIPRLIH